MRVAVRLRHRDLDRLDGCCTQSQSADCGLVGGQPQQRVRHDWRTSDGNASSWRRWRPAGGRRRQDSSPYRGHGTYMYIHGRSMGERGGKRLPWLARALAVRCSLCVAAGEARTRGQTRRCRGRWATVLGGFACFAQPFGSGGSVGLIHGPSTPGARSETSCSSSPEWCVRVPILPRAPPIAQSPVKLSRRLWSNHSLPGAGARVCTRNGTALQLRLAC
jgi:hypothetical protein